MSDEYQDDRTVPGTVFDFVITSLDWPSSVLWMLNKIGGTVSCWGTAAEIHTLKRNGIKVHAPYMDYASGMYVWELTPRDYQKAQRILGG